ncbi:HNH endonuclease [Lactococcus phage P596]|uniref:HNH homing endonuclease n=1 Tax=Lactococcus phage P596 TaxID=2656515 RepID=A0A5Q2F6T2_9CAUD|nr:HNH endonuclease [Lactococcus phage P596]QGF21066.1 HNH homing endonuclease [Lactococcus phage P596]
MKETFKDIHGYEGSYQVSNLGNVKSLPRFDSAGHKLRGKMLKTTLNRYGYEMVGLYKDGKQKLCSIHQLVALTFIPNLDNLPQVNHIDENKSNNHVTNLEWISVADNLNHGTRNQRIVDSKSKRISDGTRIFNGVRIASDITGVPVKTIIDCARGRQETAGGFRWEYVI